ncbi:HAD family hydrolase [Chitinivibrio alkaliphilus]|uniref:phosphoglycolate phosphatase n=1 Tax=Chitinivibrio alkaliphilus ACht1 TaxID=1313304 RepID=U7D9P9_9BACT|nr:HAD-IA family hydrolase [Chitinivibrio alkaliphilus]ERP31812.1 HAD family hydrolase [Chitinivibrio alkaliphilus ACht1]
MKEYDLYLFDCDGTILDTSELICKSYEFLCTRYGRPFNAQEVQRSIGIPLRRQMEFLFGPMSDTHYDTLQKEFMEYQYAHADSLLRVFPGVRDTLLQLTKHNKHLSIVTSRRRASLLRYLEFVSLKDLFEYCITPEDTALPKPAPDPVKKALSYYPPSTAVFIGDSSVDIQSGTQAGIETVFVRWNKTSLPTGCIPTTTIDTPQELLFSGASQ